MVPFLCLYPYAYIKKIPARLLEKITDSLDRFEICCSSNSVTQVRLSFKHTWDFARGFGALAETGTDDFDRILGDELDLELDPLAYPNQ